MRPPSADSSREEEIERKTQEVVVKAFEFFERNPNFPAAQVRVHEQEQEMEASNPDGTVERLTEVRFEYRLKLLDIRGEGYARLVVDAESHTAYTTIIRHYARALWFHFAGLPLDAVPLPLPFAEKPPKDPIVLWRVRLEKRIAHWLNEGYRYRAALQSDKPAQLPEPPTRNRRTLEPRPDLLTNLDGTSSRLKAAQILGITPRTLDRWVHDKKLTPVITGSHKRFRNKDLRKIIDQ
jgi:excisionase family DNA binding protein